MKKEIEKGKTMQKNTKFYYRMAIFVFVFVLFLLINTCNIFYYLYHGEREAVQIILLSFIFLFVLCCCLFIIALEKIKRAERLSRVFKMESERFIAEENYKNKQLSIFSKKLKDLSTLDIKDEGIGDWCDIIIDEFNSVKNIEISSPKKAPTKKETKKKNRESKRKNKTKELEIKKNKAFERQDDINYIEI